MDLKPNNIIVTKLLIPKIIDYGESFHPQICKESKNSFNIDYNPGFTFPYVAP